jgi:hypothetical protein
LATGGLLLTYVCGLAFSVVDSTPLMAPVAAAEPIHFKKSRRVDI